MDNNSYWLEIKNAINKRKISSKIITTDVLIIGGGISGITTAYNLMKNGINCTIAEKDTIGSKATGHTTGKITNVISDLYLKIFKSKDLKSTKLYYEALSEGMVILKNIIDIENIDCDFEKVTSYIYAQTNEGVKTLQKISNLNKHMNINFKTLTKVPLNIEVKKALSYDNQYQFHSIKYINGLVNIIKDKVKVLENISIFSIDKKNNKYECSASNLKIVCNKIVMCTKYPLNYKVNNYFSKLYQEKSYAIRFKSNKKINGQYINVDNKIRSFRHLVNENMNILVGDTISKENIDKETEFNQLKEDLFKFDKNALITHTWFSEDVFPIDYIPLIGKYNSNDEIYLISGFSKWGLSTSQIAAKVISDILLNKKNKYINLFNPRRSMHLNNPLNSFKFTKKAINGLLIARFLIKKVNLKDIKINTGSHIKFDNKTYLAYRKSNQEFIFLKPNCPHMLCSVKWNNLNKTWDCMCHGSIFRKNGKVIYGPSTKDLENVTTYIKTKYLL
ncbi:MAG: FAD-dependent oxidoreductase [Bacilli bacterium]